MSAGIKTVMVPDLSQPDEETAGMIVAKADTLYDVIMEMEDGAIR